MYCRYCGKELPSEASFCPSCGVGIGVGKNFCPSCGDPVAPGATVCGKCGTNLFTVNQNGPAQKSKLAAGLLAILLGLGIHNFYLGYTGKGVAQLLLTLCCGAGYIWCLIEGIMILTGSINTDANGVPLKD